MRGHGYPVGSSGVHQELGRAGCGVERGCPWVRLPSWGSTHQLMGVVAMLVEGFGHDFPPVVYAPLHV